MKNAIYLSSPALLSALGEGPEQHVKALFEKDYKQYLTPDDYWVFGKRLLFGAISPGIVLRDFPDDLAEDFKSRNNQLLWHALQQIEPLIEAVIKRFGKERVAVVMGTSTSGGDENIPAFENYLNQQVWSESGFSQKKSL